MRFLYLLFICSAALFAFAESVTTFQADFEQQIVDENGKKVVYNGSLSAVRPDRAYWRYDTPVSKKIYVLQDEVVMIEPDMEQAIVRKMQEEIDLFSILANAKEIDENHYEATYRSQSFMIATEKGVVASIRYRDDFDNKIELRFFNQVQNAPIPPETFQVTIPSSYDIIR